MRGMTYRGDEIRDRSFSRSSGDHNPSRHGEYHRHGVEKYPPEAERSRRIRKRDRFNGDFLSRVGKFSDYDDRDGDRLGVHVRSSRSPRRIERRGHFGRDDRMQRVRYSDYDAVSENRDRDRQSRRLYVEHPDHVDALSPKFHRDHHFDGSEKFTRRNVREDYFQKGIRDDGERDYYQHSRYSGESGTGPLSMSQCVDGSKRISAEYERGGMMRFSNSDAENLGYFHLQNQLQLERRDGNFCDRGKPYSDKEEFDFNFQDGIERPSGRETSKDMKAENLLPSRDYVNSDPDFFHSLSESMDYVSRDNLPGSSTARDIHMHSHVFPPEHELTSESIYFIGHSEKQQYVSPRRPGDQRNDIRSCSNSYPRLPKENHGDRFYAEFGRSNLYSLSTRPRDVFEEYREHHMGILDPITESSRGKHMGDDGGWDPYSSPYRRSTPDKFHANESLHAGKSDLAMFGSGSSQLEYGSEVYHGYGSMKHRESHAEVDGGALSRQSREYEPFLGRFSDSPRKMLASRQLSFGEPSERRPGDEDFRDEAFTHRAGITKANNGNNARKIYSQVNEQVDLVNLPKMQKSMKYNYGKERRMPSQKGKHQAARPLKFIKSRTSFPLKSGSGNINRRVPRKLHLSQRLVKKYKSSIKKPLGRVPPKT